MTVTSILLFQFCIVGKVCLNCQGDKKKPFLYNYHQITRFFQGNVLEHFQKIFGPIQQLLEILSVCLSVDTFFICLHVRTWNKLIKHAPIEWFLFSKIYFFSGNFFIIRNYIKITDLWDNIFLEYLFGFKLSFSVKEITILPIMIVKLRDSFQKTLLKNSHPWYIHLLGILFFIYIKSSLFSLKLPPNPILFFRKLGRNILEITDWQNILYLKSNFTQVDNLGSFPWKSVISFGEVMIL